MNWKILCSFLIVLVVFSCKEKPKEIPDEIIKETLQQANKKIVSEDKLLIDAYIKRRNWNADKTGTGLTYFIYQKNNKPRIKSNESVSIKFSLQTLEGKVIFDKNQIQKVKFKVEKDNIESGIHEVIQKMGRGEKAFVILPPHLAFGLTGTEQIPPYSILVYDLEVQE
jgi:FKBP-type peptidyl-prolyl cis-trans isomerase